MSSGHILLKNTYSQPINVEFLNKNDTVVHRDTLYSSESKSYPLYHSIRGYICNLSCKGTAPDCKGKCPRGQVTLARTKSKALWKKHNTSIDCGRYCAIGEKAICCELQKPPFTHVLVKPGKYVFNGWEIVGPTTSVFD
jgi:hypothetical protein